MPTPRSVHGIARRSSGDSPLLRALGGHFRAHREELAALVTLEMGKPIRQARSEIDKCAATCEFYAAHGAAYLAPRDVPLEGARAYVRFDPYPSPGVVSRYVGFDCPPAKRFAVSGPLKCATWRRMKTSTRPTSNS